MGSLALISIRDKQAFDITSLATSFKWSGKHGSAARSLTAELKDDAQGDRAQISVEQGDQCMFLLDGEELFRGMFMKQQQSDGRILTVTAYDSAYRLANNKDTFAYKNITAGNVFLDVCKRFGIPYGGIADTGHVIPELTKPRTTGWDVICEALQQTYKATGVRYYVLSERGELKLFERRKNLRPWVIEPEANMTAWKYSVSTEKIKTRIKMYSKEGAVLAEAKNETLEQVIGQYMDVESEKRDMNQAQMQEAVTETLNEKSKPEYTIDVDALGNTDVITGYGVYTIINDVGLAGVYYVESDTHTFCNGSHTMALKLSAAQDIE